MSDLNDILARLDEGASKWTGDPWPAKTAAFIRAQATRIETAEESLREARQALRRHQPHLSHAAITLIDRWLEGAET